MMKGKYSIILYVLFAQKDTESKSSMFLALYNTLCFVIKGFIFQHLLYISRKSKVFMTPQTPFYIYTFNVTHFLSEDLFYINTNN